MKILGAAAASLMVLAGCAGRSGSSNPYVPPEATYSAGSTLAAAGGAMAAAVGAELMSHGHSPRSRNAGVGLLAAGVGLLGAALVEAIQVEDARRRLIMTDTAWRMHYLNRPIPEPFRAPPPPLPDVPIEFPEEESPLGGGPP